MQEGIRLDTRQAAECAIYSDGDEIATYEAPNTTVVWTPEPNLTPRAVAT